MLTATTLAEALTMYDRHIRSADAASGLATLAAVAYDDNGDVAYEIADTVAEIARAADLEPADPEAVGFATESPMDVVQDAADAYRAMLRIELQRHADTHPCNDCGRPVTYDTSRNVWRHVLAQDARLGCFLAPAESEPVADDIPTPSGYADHAAAQRAAVSG